MNIPPQADQGVYSVRLRRIILRFCGSLLTLNVEP
jgi:hypothetical protein